jgi:O-antigen/teichoic acid export membrane protein
VRVSWPLLRQSLAYGLKGHLGSVLVQFTNRFDTVLVLPWLGAAALGYYSIAVGLAEKLTLLTTSVQFVLFPRIASSEKAEADRITPMVCRNTFWWMAAGAVVMLGLGRFLIRLFYSDQYLPALHAYQILLPGIVALTYSGLLYSDFSGRNRRFLPTLAMFAGFLVNLTLNFLWIRRIGIAGAALASTLAYVTQSAVMVVFFWRVTGISPLWLIVPRREDWRMYRELWARLRPRPSGN